MLRSALLLVGAALVAGFVADFTPLDDDEHELMYESDFYSDTFRTGLVTRAAPNVCSGGSVSLQSEDDPAPCVLREGNNNQEVKILRSPNNNAGQCDMTFSSDAPGFIRANLTKANLSDDDKLVVMGAFGDEYEFSNADVGKGFIAPTTFGSIRYEGSVETRAKMERDFVLRAVPKSNNCQKIIDAPAGTGGRLIFPGFDQRPYRAGTMCQWWIRAPEGKHIKIKFNAFNVGDDDVADCQGSDYIGIDKSGDPNYTTSPVKFCGSTIPEDTVSDGNAINVLGYGARGGKGFCCTYEVIDPPASP